MPAPAPKRLDGPPTTPAPIAYSAAELDRLALAIAGEARGEGEEGMTAVAHVAINRLRTGFKGAKSLDDVLQPKQFNGLEGQDIPPEDLQRARAVALAVLSGETPDPTGGARHYYAPRRMSKGEPPKWAAEGTLSATIGSHRFYTGVR